MIQAVDCFKKYGDPRGTQFQPTWMTMYQVDPDIGALIPCLPHKIYLNKDLVTPLDNVLIEIYNQGLCPLITEWGGAFNIRVVRGFEQKFNELYGKGLIEAADNLLSMHSWAIAWDWNMSTNALGQK